MPIHRTRFAPLPGARRASLRLWPWPLALAGGLLLVCTGIDAEPGLALASWNLEHLAAADGAGCRPRGKDEYAALRRIGERLDADVVALQEVENEAAVARVFDPAVYDIVVSGHQQPRPDHCRGFPGQRRTAQHTGFAINRTRLDALGLRYRTLPPDRDIGVDAGRWAARVAIEPRSDPHNKGIRLELMSLHLKSGCGWGRLDGRDVRRKQCRALRRERGMLEQWIDARAAADMPFVLAGDFNRQLDQPNDDFWRAIDDGEVCRWRPDRALGRRCQPGTVRLDPDADLRLANAGIPFRYAHNARFPYALDHFVLGGAASEWIVGGSYSALGYGAEPPPSDHHPIRIVLRPPWLRR